MKLFEYRPTEYVDVNPDLPLEFMQTQVTNAQNKYDAQNKAINETAANFMKLNPGLFTREEYERIKDKYTAQIESLTGELSKYGDVASIVPQYSKLVSDISFDPSIKALNQDYLAYQDHLKFMAENPDAIDLSKEGPQYGPDQPLDLSRYRGVKPEDSIKEIRDVILKDFKPNKDVLTNKWHITDPRDGTLITGSTEQEVTELAAPRIAQAFEDYYPAWVANTTGKAEYDMRKLSNNDLSVYQDEAKGRELYNKLWEPYKQAAYRQVSQEQQQVTGGANATKASTATPPPPPAYTSPQSTTEQYGYDQLGSIYGDPNNSPINSQESLDLHLTNLQADKNKLFAQANLLKSKGDTVGSDASMVKWYALDERLKVDHAWKKAIEAELYGKKANPDEKKQAEIKTFGSMPGFPEVDEDNYGVDYSFVRRGNEYFLKYLKGYRDPFGITANNKPPGYEQPIGNITEKNKSTGSTLEEKLVSNLSAEQQKLYEKYKKYINFQTSGHSYIIGEDTRKEVDVIALSLFNSGKKPKDPMTDKEIGSFPEFQTQLFSHKKDDESYAFDHFSYEILMDEKDGPVLIVTGINPSGKNNIVEYELKDTPNIRILLGKLAPNEAVINSSFIEATQTMKAGNNRKGDFSIGRVGGKTDKHEFTKMPVGDGLFMYKDADGALHDNLYALITSKHAAAYMEDSNHVAAAQILSSKIDQARESKDPAQLEKAINDYKTYMDSHKNDASSGKQNPQSKEQGQDLGW